MPDLLNEKQFEAMVIQIGGHMLAAVTLGMANPKMKEDEAKAIVTKLTSSLAADIMTMDENGVSDDGVTMDENGVSDG
jgi:hypothetical protein